MRGVPPALGRVAWLVAALAVGACGGDDALIDAGPSGPALTVPDLIALPYVAAGAGPSELAVTIANPGTEDVRGADGGPLAWRVDGDADFAIVDGPAAVSAGGTATLALRWAGAAAPRIAGATLAVDSSAGPRAAELWAVAGDPTLPPATFTPVTGPGGVTIGASAEVAMPTAPFPAPGRPWTDARVHLFVPADYRQRDAHDVVLHFHGHNTTLAATIPAHGYREQVWASGVDAILVVPQGPVDAASGDFGKLADPAGTAAFLDEVLAVLYRAGAITRPVLGDVTLTSHSGGYAAVAANLAADAPFAVGQVDLFDSLYGYLATYRDFVLGGGRLRSSYTSGGGTDGNNQTLAAMLAGAGIAVAAAPTPGALRDARGVIYFTAASHDGATRDDGAFGEQLRWGGRHSRRGPRAELRTAVAAAGGATVTWLAPHDDDVTGWRVETSPDGAAWTTAATTAADAATASIALRAPALVRVVPIVAGVAVGAAQPTDTVRVAPGADAPVLIVDGFDRLIDGSSGRLAHDFAAQVGAGVGPLHAASARAITDDGLALAPYRAVIWLVGDESVADHTFTAAERAAIDAYVAGGGRVILSGSEIGYELGPTTAGSAWLAGLAGASYASDDAGASAVRGAGPLATVPDLGFGGPAAAYPEEYPDVYAATGAGVVVLTYATGGAAAVGIPGRAVVVGFPLEIVDRAEQRAALVAALLAFVAP
ncbi:MAG: hypothetical protein IPL61_09100 [Myxococcales bacterium]|nr:hypothetical protein [Myxococcales bacterium]